MIDETKFQSPGEMQDEAVPWKPSKDVRKCERAGGHIVQAPSWPPTKSPSKDEAPSFTLPCTRCEAWVVVYSDEQPGVKVLKPGSEPAKK